MMSIFTKDKPLHFPDRCTNHRFRLANFLREKIKIIFLLISVNICFGVQKNCLIEMLLLSTHFICFG